MFVTPLSSYGAESDDVDTRFEGYLDFESGVEFYDEDNYGSGSDVSGAGYGYFEFALNEFGTIESEISWLSGDDGMFFDRDQQELWIDTLYLAYNFSNWYVEVGKIDPLYESWDLTWGWYAGYQSEDLDLSLIHI